MFSEIGLLFVLIPLKRQPHDTHPTPSFYPALALREQTVRSSGVR